MWYRDYEDYPNDRPAKKQKVEPGHGIVGCEMHEMLSWQETLHRRRKRRPGWFGNLLNVLFRGK